MAVPVDSPPVIVYNPIGLNFDELETVDNICHDPYGPNSCAPGGVNFEDPVSTDYVKPVPSRAKAVCDWLLVKHETEEGGALLRLIYGSIDKTDHPKASATFLKGFREKIDSEWKTKELIDQVVADLRRTDFIVNGNSYKKTEGSVEERLYLIFCNEFGMPFIGGDGLPAKENIFEKIYGFLNTRTSADRDSILTFLCCFQQGGASLAFNVIQPNIDTQETAVVEGGRTVRGIFKQGQQELWIDQIIILKSLDMDPKIKNPEDYRIRAQTTYDILHPEKTKITWTKC